MENNGYGSPSTRCVHLLNVDPNQYSYLDFVDDISGLANNDGINN